MTTCGAPDGLTHIGARTFLLLSHLLGSQNKYQQESARTEARQSVGSAKQVSKLSLGQNKHGQHITTPIQRLNYELLDEEEAEDGEVEGEWEVVDDQQVDDGEDDLHISEPDSLKPK